MVISYKVILFIQKKKRLNNLAVMSSKIQAQKKLLGKTQITKAKLMTFRTQRTAI